MSTHTETHRPSEQVGSDDYTTQSEHNGDGTRAGGEDTLTTSHTNGGMNASRLAIPAHWAIFPVAARDKVPHRSVTSWPGESRPRPDWKGGWPRDANTGIDCGKSGLTVLDEDEPDAVTTWLGYTPDTYTVRTGKGRHFYFAANGTRLRNGVRVAPGVDVRSEGGYVVGPGSTHETGHVYQVSNDREPIPLPADVAARLGASRTADGTTPNDILDQDPPFELPERITNGTRNDILFRYACSLRARAVRGGEALTLLKSAYARCESPYTDESPEDMWARTSSTYPEGSSDDKPQCGRKPELDVTSAAIALDWARKHLGNGSTKDLFRRGAPGTQLVRIPLLGDPDYLPPKHMTDSNGPATIAPLADIAGVCSLMSARFDLYRMVEQKEKAPKRVAAQYPTSAARDIAGGPEFMTGARWLAGATHTPALRRDGTVLDKPGYDDASGVVYLPDEGLHVPPIPAEPTPAQVTDAAKLLLDLVRDFPFVSDSDRANYLGAMLTPILRTVTDGPSKLVAIQAPMPGSGKSLLAEILYELHGSVVRGPFPDGEELRKEIVTILTTTTAPVVTFDNHSGVLRSTILANLLTSSLYENRSLGSNRQVSAPNDRLWVVTGNNMALGGDIPRRTVTVTIDPKMPNPDQRTNFAIPNLRMHVRARRGEILAALLTLARAWHVAGRPVTRGPSDTFQSWREAVGGVLTHAGVAGTFDDPATAPEPIGVDDTDWAAFLAAIWGIYQDRVWTVAELLTHLDTSTDLLMGDPGKPLKVDDLPAELADKLRGQASGARTISRPLGVWLKNRNGRWAGELTCRRAGDDAHSKTAQWRLERTSS